MLKKIPNLPAWLWLCFLVTAIAIWVVTCRGQKDDKPSTINVPTLTPPAAVTSEPTNAEVEALERLKHHEDYRKGHAND